MRLAPLALCLAATLTAAPGARAGDDERPSLDDTPHITVTGTAAAAAVPDQAEIRVGVGVERPSADAAWDEDARRVKAVVDAAKSAGIKPQDIATVGVELYQQRRMVEGPGGVARNEPTGFRANHELRIRVAALDSIGSLAAALIARGADTFGGVTFSVAHPETIEDKLRADALRDARHQAETLAAAAGVKLGALLSIERPDRQVAVRPFMRARNAGPPTTDVEPGTQTLSAEVEASWAVE